MLGRRSRILVLAAVLATVVLGVYVHQHQSAGAMGGRISAPKLAWLLYTVFVWGLLCPILAFEPAVRRPFRVLAGLFAALMVARIVAEIPMLYVWKNWRPPYGMVHDVVREHLLRSHPALQGCDFYLCGPPVMLAATRTMLSELGVPDDRVAFDDFKI